ncbi:MAG: biotin/lipoyl-binding protein [Chloroflexota bacterium]|nr:biotin/lipoyl-binding protein [Chloroflexota bacterium]
MTAGLEARVAGDIVEPAEDWRITFIDVDRRIARLSDGTRSLLAAVEGAGDDWVVTLRGRRIRVTVRTWRERVLAEAESAATGSRGPIEIRATLPGLVVSLSCEEGSEVAEGDPLLTLEAMKMQNEVRAPRAGRVTHRAVSPGETVARGALLLRLE